MSNRTLTISALLTCCCALLLSSTSAGASVTCTKYASPSGSDSSGDGSLANPYQSVVRLDTSLSPGQTGCLRAGTYGGTSTFHDLTASGNSSGQITITAYPGEQATVVGWIAMDGSYTTLSGLNIDGSNTFYNQQRTGTNCPYPVSQGLAIGGSNDVFEYNNFYQSVASLRGNGIGIGWSGQPDNTTVRYNRIHDVGQCLDFDHLVYLAHGNNVQIYDNWLWNDAHGWGVQIYPGPQNAQVHHNVIDAAGSGFTVADDGGGTTSGNNIYDNVALNSTGITGTWGSMQGVLVSSPGVSGAGNVVNQNDSFNNPGGVANIGSVSSSNLAVTNNIASDPQFVDAASHNYQVQSGSPIASWGMWDGSGSPSPSPTPTPAPAPTPTPNPTPTPTPGTNLALNMPAQASSSWTSGSGPANADDGSTSTYWQSAVGSANQWWQVDLGSSRSVGTVSVYWGGAYAGSYSIKAYLGGKWRTIATASATGSGWVNSPFAAVSTRYVRVFGTPATGSGLQIGEVQVFAPGVSVSHSVLLKHHRKRKHHAKKHRQAQSSFAAVR